MRALRKVLHMAATDEEVLSQSNPKNPDGNFWCGRTSASIVYNYYARLGKVPGPIKNQSDKAPYQLLYPDQTFAALLADGRCAPMEAFDRLTKAGVGKWAYKPLYPKDQRSGNPDVEAIFGPLLDHLDRNNPAFFASGFSESDKYASHFVTISGYRFKNGALWFQITDPATNHATILNLLKKADVPNDVAKSYIEIEQRGLWATANATVKPYGSRYWVHQDVFWKANQKLKNHPAMVAQGYPDPLLCDNSYQPGLSVIIDDSGLPTSDVYAETELAAGWPIMPHRGEAGPSIEELGLWTGVLIERASYPLGSVLTWHGGVHIRAEAAAGGLVYAMGPGEIVLARFPDEDPAAPRPSNGFVLVKHRVDRVRRTLLEPAATSSDGLDLYAVSMHVGSLGGFLEPDPEQGIDVLRADAPKWLRSICPERLPKLKKFVSRTALRHVAFQADVAAAEAGRWSSLPPAATESGTVGADLDMIEEGGKITLAGAPSSKVKVGDAEHYVLACGAISAKALATKALTEFQPVLAAADKVHYHNPLTGEVLKIAALPAAKGSAVKLDETPGAPPRVASFKVGDKDYVELVYERPAMYDSASAGIIEGQRLRIFKQPVTLSAAVGGESATSTLAPGDHRLFIEFSGDEPALAPVATGSKKELDDWKALAAKGKPVLVPRDKVTRLFNTVTEELWPVTLPAGGDLLLATRSAKKGAPLRFVELGGSAYVEVAGVGLSLTHEPGDGAPGDRVIFFEHATSKVSLYAKTGRSNKGRWCIKETAFELKNSDALLAFRCAERDATAQQIRDLELVPCVPIAADQIDKWNQELASAARSRLDAARKRLADGTTRLMGVKFGGKSGWKLGDKDGAPLIQPAPLEDTARPRRFCEVDVKDGVLALQEIKPGTASSPWDVGVPDGTTIHPLCILEGTKEPWGAVFEMLASTPAELSDNGDERKVAKDENDKRQPKMAGYRKGEIITPPSGPLCQVSRTPIGRFGDDGYVHVEMFAAENPVDKKAKGTNEKIERVGGTPFCVLRDDDSKDDYTPEFVERIVAELTSGKLHDVDTRAVAAARERGDVVRPDEWEAFTAANASALSLLVTAHASEWHPSQREVLDKVGGDGRGLHLTKHQVEAHKREIERLAFLDRLAGAPPPADPVYHVHPFRFLEWLLTGVDVTAKGAPSGKLALEHGTAKLDLVKDEPGEARPAANGTDGSRTVHRGRLMIGDGLAAIPATLVLDGFKTQNPKLSLVIKRSNTTTLTVVSPTVRARLESDARGGLDTTVGVYLMPAVKDGTLLPDGGKIPDHQLSYARAVLEVEYNLVPPTKITAKLSAPGFRLRAVTDKLQVASDAQSATLAPARPPAGPFAGSQSLSVVVDVLAGTDADKKAKVQFEVEGGDFPSKATAEVEVKTTKRVELGDGPGEDIAKLQLMLSQIEGEDGKPCYRYTGWDKQKNTVTEYSHGGAGSVLVDGAYKLQLARALWRFFYTFAPSLKTKTIELPPPKSPSKNKAPPPGAPTSVPVADLRTGLNGAKEARAVRESNDCKEYPSITPDVIADVVRHFEPPHVMPKVSMAVSAGVGAAPADIVGSVSLSKDWESTDLSRSALLSVAGDFVTLTVSAPSVASLGGSITVDLDVKAGGAYKLKDPGQAALAFTGAKTSFDVVLEHSGNPSVKPEDNLVTATATIRGSKYTLGSVQLFGCRDLTSAPKDGVARRDSALVQALLAAHGLYRPPASKTAVLLDGKWTDAAKGALAEFQKVGPAPSGPGAIQALVDAQGISLGP